MFFKPKIYAHTAEHILFSKECTIDGITSENLEYGEGSLLEGAVTA